MLILTRLQPFAKQLFICLLSFRTYTHTERRNWLKSIDTKNIGQYTIITNNTTSTTTFPSDNSTNGDSPTFPTVNSKQNQRTRPIAERKIITTQSSTDNNKETISNGKKM